MLVTMLQRSAVRISDVAADLPVFSIAHEQVRVPWESKGAVLRKIAEQTVRGRRVEMLDGIKIYDEESWVLVLPDSVEPLFHIYAESAEESSSKLLAGDYVRRIESML
jgi:mannose-1-phosphate guanylyltransferase / phosphomannomutase